MSFVYLASPYTHGDPKVVEERAAAAAAFTAAHLRKGVFIYSPIVHCHELAKVHDLPKDFEFWKSYNFAMLSKASELWLLTLEGWQTSKGVREERAFAKSFNLPFLFVL